MIVGVPEVDCLVDCVAFETSGHGANAGKAMPAIVLNQAMAITRAGGSIGVPGLYVTENPGATDESSKQGSLKICFGLGWAKSRSFHTGKTPVMKYHRQLINAILHDKINISKALNAEVISLKDAPRGYAEFDSGVAKKVVIDPHGMIRR